MKRLISILLIVILVMSVCAALSGCDSPTVSVRSSLDINNSFAGSRTVTVVYPLSVNIDAIKDTLVADAPAADIENATNFIRNNPGCGLMLVEEIQFQRESQYAGDRVAAKKGEAELMYFVNGVIDEMLADGRYSKWYEEAQLRANELGL